MEWTQALTIIGSNIAILLWARREAMQDWRMSEAKIEAYRADTEALIERNRKETQVLLNAIHQDMKDFHGRLCSIATKQGINQ